MGQGTSRGDDGIGEGREAGDTCKIQAVGQAEEKLAAHLQRRVSFPAEDISRAGAGQDLLENRL